MNSLCHALSPHWPRVLFSHWRPLVQCSLPIKQRLRGAYFWRRHFSRDRPTRLMELTGFSEEQLEVREAISQICSDYPDDYWAAHDESGEYPHELHAALAKDGWIGIALPESLGGAGLGISEATMMLQTISQSGAGIAGSQSIHANVYATQPIAKFASPQQQKQMLPRLIKGEMKVCFGVTEPRLDEQPCKSGNHSLKL